MRRIAGKIALLIGMLFIVSVYAYADDMGTGERLYKKHCAWCHGDSGKGDGAASAYMLPKPRNFVDGIYKYKSTPYDEVSPSDEDIERTIKNGLVGTAMPSWKDVLSDAEVRELIKYLKRLGKLDEPKKGAVKYKDNGASIDLERGKELYKERCAECHGKEGRGNPSKRLKDDWGNTVWPRNFTRPETFRAGNSVEYIYTRLTVGTPGTPMPSYEDPENDKSLNEEDRRTLAAYVAAFGKAANALSRERVIGARVEGTLPETTNNTLWEKSLKGEFLLAPQLLYKEKLYSATIMNLSARLLYNKSDAAILLEWDDPTESIPGDAGAAKIAGGPVEADTVAIEFPSSFAFGTEQRVPHFAMGEETREVTILAWKNKVRDGEVRVLKGGGYKSLKDDGVLKGAVARAEYRDGAWRVIIKASLVELKTLGVDVEGTSSVPMAFAAWDGSNGEKGSRHSVTAWKELKLRESSSRRWLFPLLVFAFVLTVEIAWLRSRT